MFRFVTMLILVVLLAAGCGTQMDKYQGQTNRKDVQNMGANDSVTRDTENPRMIHNVGDTWGNKQDRKLMKEAAADVPGVTVNRVIFNAGQARVNVSVDSDDDLSDNEKKEWKEQIEQSIYRAVPRYDIQVTIK